MIQDSPHVGDDLENARQIDITPAMLSAGVSALEACRGAFDDWGLVRAVYIAMQQLADLQPCPAQNLASNAHE